MATVVIVAAACSGLLLGWLIRATYDHHARRARRTAHVRRSRRARRRAQQRAVRDRRPS